MKRISIKPRMREILELKQTTSIHRKILIIFFFKKKHFKYGAKNQILSSKGEKRDSFVYFGDQSQLSHPEILQDFDMILNHEFGFISCGHQNCGTILTSKSWQRHVIENHNLKVKKDISFEITDLFGTLNPVSLPPLDMKPIQGLLTFSNGCECLLCPHEETRFLSETREGMRNHMKKSHPQKDLLYQSARFQQTGHRLLRFKVGSFIPSNHRIYFLWNNIIREE